MVAAPVRRRFASRALLALVAGLCAASCAPKPRTAKGGPAPAATPPPVSSRSDGEVASTPDGTVYLDRTAGFDLSVPEGWSARARFDGDSAGPPPVGDLRVRLASDEGCVIDLAVEPAASGDDVLRESLRRGRELFFFAPIGEPRPALETKSIWSATLVPADPSRLDVGYWIALDEKKRLLRVEGRFPVERVAACKDGLDQVVRSIRAHGASLPSTGAAAGTGPGATTR